LLDVLVSSGGGFPGGVAEGTWDAGDVELFEEFEVGVVGDGGRGHGGRL
jgi:hypothetical protein